MSVPLEILSCIATVVPRRITQGARHPAWSLAYEIGVEVCSRQIDPDRTLTPRGRRAPEATPIPLALRRKLRLERTTLAGLPTEQITPQGWEPGGQVLLFLHGGGYFACSPGTHRAMIARIACTSGARCISPDYRLAPEHPFPNGIDDCFAAYRELLAGGIDPARLFVGGDSAGGGLTLAVFQRARDAGEPLPRGAVLLSPWVDLQAEGGSIHDNARYDYLPADEQRVRIQDMYLPEGNFADPLVSPTLADLRGFPPMLMLTGRLEIMLDQHVAFAEHARAQGVELTHVIEDSMVHVYPLLADVSPQARHSFQQIADFLASHA